MKNLSFLTILFLFISLSINAQDKKWSIEANYPISIGEDLGNDAPGIIDLGIKYRFLDFNVVKIGAGLNAGIFKHNVKAFTVPESMDFDETNWIIQPKVFAELSIPALKKFHPSFGLGYSIINTKLDGYTIGGELDYNDFDGGLNLNIGFSYDFSDKFFIQAQYDYIRHNIRAESSNNTIKSNQNLGLFKAGVGFRF